jgi:hypothetical protein
VSDFFSAYESVPCPQQKCLLHFLRDINDDLKLNPFDTEFKSFAQDFAGLLRRAVDTADRHGLAKQAFAPLVPDVRRFEERVSTGTFTSEVMLGYQKRVKKAAGRLFTFLEHDNVPWNNNNAEHAMKVFAKFGRLADGMFSERSLAESLLLLSICQTCHFNGVNPLRFLLSGKGDLASILAGTCVKRGEPTGSGRWVSTAADRKPLMEGTGPVPVTVPCATVTDGIHPIEHVEAGPQQGFPPGGLTEPAGESRRDCLQPGP